MADKTIYELPAADAVQSDDLFVLEQDDVAKKLTGQILENWLLDLAQGHGGITDVNYTAPVPPSLNGTLTITLADNTESSFPVTNGRGISSIYWTESGTAGDGMIHEGTFNYNDGTTSTVEIQDGVKGDTGDQTYVWIRYATSYPPTTLLTDPNEWIGIYVGLSDDAPSEYSSYAWYQYKGDQGDTGNGIQSIALYQTVGATDEYRITYTNGTYSYFSVQNGSNIQSITKTSTSGLVDTYTVLLTNGNTSTFTVNNGKGIVSLTMISGTHAAGTTDVYRIIYNDGDTFDFGIYNGANGLGSVSTVSGIQADGNGNVPQVISGNGAPTTATVGQLNQLYYDLTNSSLYYCAGESGGTYIWSGTSVAVDSALSTTSPNPVQNAVITNRVGTAALPNSLTNLTAAINYVHGEIPSAASTTPSADTTGGAVGTGTAYARNDHRHPLNVPTGGTPSALGTASQGSASTYSRSDHIHAMPSRTDLGLGDVSLDDVVPIARGGTGATNDTTALQNLRALNLSIGTKIPANSDLDDYTTVGTYYCASNSDATTLSHTPAGLANAFRLVVYAKNNTTNIGQELYPNNNEECYIRFKTSSWGGGWRKVLDTTDLPLSVAKGGTGRNTITANAILTGNGTSAVAPVATAKGAFYATSANGAPTFGTLPVAEGGTGRATITSNAILAGNTTSAVKMIATASGALYATAANGAASFGTLPIAQGGTGGMTVVTKNTTSTSNDAITAEYTVSGSGIVIAYAAIYSNTNDDYGTWQAEIYYDGTLIMGEGSRLTTANTQRYGASTSVPIEVTNGKKIKITLLCTKGGTKNIFRRFLCFGCTVS